MSALRNHMVLILLALFCTGLTARGQNVTKLEYFFDTDPGFGKATSVTVTPGQDVTASFSVDIAALSNGFHSLYVRGYIPPYQLTQNGSTVTKGGWSLTNVRSFYKESASNIGNAALSPVTAGEYFVDTDPGLGKGSSIPVTQGTDLTNVSFAFDVTAMGKGFHTLYVRFKDAKGVWSMTAVRSFYRETVTGSNNTLADVTKGEYFIDTDPGFGKGKNISFTAGKDLTNVTFTVDVTALANGFHQLYTRFRDANGMWSYTANRSFYKETVTNTSPGSLAKITAGEYFFDADPGLGKGTAMALTSSTDVNNLTFAADITALQRGFHQLYVRFKDANGVWGFTSNRSFYKETVSGTSTTLAKIVRLEYFVDADPGFGKGTKVTVAPTLNDSLAFNMDMSNVTIGNHKVYVRALDEQGVWSLVSSGDFKVNPPTDLIIKIGEINNTVCVGSKFAVPYSVNAPFGSNNSFTVQLSDLNGSFNNPTNIGTLTKNTGDTIQATIPAGISAGNNYRIRVIASSPLDTSGASGPIAIKRVPEGYYVINGTTPVCLGAAMYSISQVDAAATVYNWSVTGGGTLDTTKGTSVKLNWTTAGVYTVKVTAANACGNGGEKTISVRVYAGKPVYAPTITANGNTLSVSKTPPVDSVYAYKWYKDSVAIPNATNYAYAASQDGKYTVAYTNPCGEGPMSNVIQFIANKQSQTITFTQVADKTYGQVSYVVLGATASSGLPVTYSLLQGSGTIKSDTLYITAAGAFKVRASQAGSMTYAPATADMTFEVKKAAAQITFGNLTQVYNGSAKQATVTTTPSNLSVSLTYNGASTAPVNAGTYKVVATINATNYQGADSASFVIQKAAQTITLAKVPDLPLSTANYKLSATASSGLPVSLSLTASPVGSVVLSNDTLYTKGGGTGYLVVSQAGNSNYEAAPVVKDTFEVKKGLQSINFPAIADKPWGTAPFALNATATSGLPISYRIVSGPATLNGSIVTLTGTGTVVIEASQGGNAIYNAATAVQRSFAVVSYPDLFVQNVTADKTNIGPGENVTVSWKVANIGTGPSPVKWTERISMQASGGANKTIIGLFNFTDATPLDTAKSLSRSTVVTMPASLNIGDQGYFVVELVPDTSVHEGAGNVANNTAVQATAWNIKKLLAFDLSANQINEGQANGVTATISRSGSLASALTVNITAKYPQRFTLPSSITIPAGQAGALFTISAPDNNVVEGALLDTIQVSAAGFASEKEGLMLVENDQATLTLSGIPAQANEGDSVKFTISTNLIPTSPLTVYLTSNNKKLTLPASVVIPAGAPSVAVGVLIAQNTTPEVDQAIEIKAGAGAHNPAVASLTIKDDDLPNLELVLQTNTVSEGAGFYATQATLRRTSTGNPVAFTVNLSANTPNAVILPGTITLGANENEKTFNVGVVDNTLVDGQRQVAITASVFIASCGCSAPPTTSGSVTANLTINDNDGPALTLTATPLTLPEGASTAGLLRITRNTSTAASLTVTLSTSDSSEATLPATATIPAGKTFVDVPITTINDGITDGSQTVYFGAKATGFSAGSVWVMVTDQNKPDLLVQSASLGDSSVQALNLFNYTVSIKNNGFATAPSGVVVYGYLSKDEVIDAADSLLIIDTLSAAIPAGQSSPLLNAVKAPNKPGKYKVLFKVNPESAMTELLLTNNTAQPLALTIKPDYTATAVVQPVYVQQGDTVRITGTATKANGSLATGVPVEVYVITGGLRRTVTATTNGSGQYTAQFVPMRKEAGHYSVGASFPGIGLTDEQDAFDILGVRINGNTVPQYKLILNDTLKGSLTVENLSNVALTNFTLKPLSLPNGAVIQFTPIASLAGNGSAKLNYSIVGKTLSVGTNFEVASFEAVATQGLKQAFDMFYFCQAPNAYVVSDAGKIDVAVSSSVGERLVSFKLINKGQGSTGAITINLPQASWLTNVTPKMVPSLATGDTALVVLKFQATTDVPFNVPVNSSIGIGVPNGNSFSLPFTFEKKAESKGVVVVNATDQFTFYSEGAPKVKGAHVQIKNYFSGAVYADGVTGDDGVFKATGVPEGKHRIVVEKEKHQSSDGTVDVNPGDTTETSVFLNYKAIEYSWSVVPTAVQDQYDITLNAQFETHVPMPVVTIEMPKTMPQLSGSETYAFNVTLTNHGLIAAKDVTLGLPNSDPEYEFVTNYVPADLMAQQSIQVPVIMRRRTQGIAGAQASGISIAAISRELGIAPVALRTAGANIKCTDYADVQYWYKCSLSSGLWEKGGTLFSYSGRACFGGGITEAIVEYDPKPYNGDPQKKDPKCAICPEIPVGNGTGPTFEFKEEKKSCMDCIIDMFKAAGECLGIGPDNLEFSGSVGDKIQRIKDLYDQASGYYDNAQTAICVAQALANGDVEGAMNCIPLPDPPGLPCAEAIGEAAMTCANTGVAGGGSSRVMNKESMKLNARTMGANIKANGAAKAMADAGGSGAEVFRTIGNNFRLAVKTYRFRTLWSQEYFGEMAKSDAFRKLATLLSPYVTKLDSIRPAAQTSILAAMDGYEIQPFAIQSFITRWNTSLAARKAGVLQPNADYPGIINWKAVYAYADSISKASEKAISLGYASVGDMYIETFRGVREILDGQSNQAACASVTVQFSQKLTMTREAFEGTLSIFNGHPTDKMDSLSVNIQITDEAGVPSNGLFQINTKSLTNLSDVTGTGQIAGQGTGVVKFLFIPEVGAAPTEPKRYKFGGNIRYFDPYQKRIVTMPMSDVVLTVNPSPNLMLHYFMQRNILGDDALTTPDIEPSEPAELAVMVENQGYGPAVNMTISSAQPKVVENEKGLAINFNLTGSNFQGQPTKLGVTNINFGTIPGRQTRIGQWYFTSSLLGKFVSYDAKVVHANSFGNPELSLVKGVKLHELTKSIRAYAAGEDNINDFLVNDIFDVDDMPDAIYFSQGQRTENVYKATSGSFNTAVSGPSFTNTLTVTASKAGWNYIKIADPGNRRYDLVSVTRNSDGKSIPLDNAWLTFVTLPASRPPVYENKFHFVDSFATQTAVSYTVVWKPRNMAVPKIVKIEGAPESTTAEQVKKLTVVFDKAIDASSFTKEDLTLTLQGGQNIINNSVVIKAIDTASFEVDLSSLTAANGFFNFTAQAAGVKDIYGISGTVGKQVTWTQFLNVPAVQRFTRLPEGNKASAFDTIGVFFNMPIDRNTVTPQRFIITKDGVAQSGSMVIDSVSADKKLYYLSGLGAILTTSGEYQFTVDLPNIKSTTNVAGTAQQSVKLTLDNSGPTLVSFAKVDSGGLDPQHIAFAKLQFNEDVVGLNTSSLKLTRNGQTLPITYDMLLMLDNKNWLAGNFGMLSYPDGAYTLSIDMSTVKDAIGNSGTGTQSLSWTVNRAALITVANLAVSPDLGYAATDGITASDSLMVSFNISKNAAEITLSQVDLSGETVLKTVTNQLAGAVSIPVKGLKGGNSSLRISVKGENGGTTTATKDLYIDNTPLTGQWQAAAGQVLKQQVDTIPFLFSAKLLSSTGLLNAIQLKRNDVTLANTGLVVKQLNDSLYQISGLRQASSNTPGNYQMLLNLQSLKKWSSGINGNNIASISWSLLNPNRAPVAVAGNDTIVKQTGTLLLNGSGSSDPDGSQITYRWVAPQGIVLNDSTLAKPSFTITSANNGNKYSFLLIVSDGDLFSTSTVNVTVSLCSVEVCNGVDDDCDGLIDEGFTTTYYKDNDGDGFGIAGETVTASQCAPPAGYANYAGDCNDANAAVYPGSDGDGCSTCTTDGVTFYAGSGTSFQWQVDDGTGFKNIQDNQVYTGATQRYLQLKQPPTSWSGYTYRCVVTRNGIQSVSASRVLKFVISWKGTVNSAWENAANWSCNKVPDQYTDVKIENNVPVVISSAASAKSVTLSANSKVTISKGATLNVKK